MKNIIITFLVCFFSLFWQESTFGQNVNCASAATITPGAAGATCAASSVGGSLIGFATTTACTRTSRAGFYTFSATATTHTVSVTGNTNFDAMLSIGTSCASPTDLISCQDGSVGGGTEAATLTGLTIGGTYIVTVRNFSTNTNNNVSNQNFTICVTTPAPAPPAPANDTCAGAVSVTQTANGTCTNTAGTVLGATQTIVACTGSGTTDVWYSFVATATSAVVRRTAGFDSALEIMTGCGTGSLLCADPETDQTVTGLTIGVTYYYRIYYWSSGTPATPTFTTCVMQPLPPITNDECTSAVNVIVPALGGGCNSTSASIIGATASAQANTCVGTANDDVWFSFTATSNSISLALNNVGGSTTDLVHSIYAGTCGALGATLVCSDPNTSSVSGLTIGNLYFVRVYSYTATVGQTTTFNLCITAAGPCGNAANNDFCSNPAILTIGTGNFDSSTSSTYSADAPANTSTAFCGSIENNSWYQFTATQTTHDFNFTIVSGCTSAFGIQAQVFEITRDANGCCTNLTSMSNCFNPGTPILGAVNAVGLTIGAQYVIMIDGWGGDQCNFRVAGWTAVGVLPVDLLSFNAKAMPDGNKLTWETIAERNNKQFEIQKSADITNWETIGTVLGAGTSDVIKTYSFIDDNVKGIINYYRLKQIDKTGEFKYSQIVSIKNMIETVFISPLRPNPATSFIEFDINTKNIETINIQIVDMLGKTLLSQIKQLTNGFQTANINIENLNNGFYTIIITNNKDVKKTFKFVKLD